MTITILTLFPEMFASVFSRATIKRAIDKKKVSVNFVNIRDFAVNSHKTVDDKPDGGGPGMILKIDVVVAALESVVKSQVDKKEQKIILLSPQGKLFNDKRAREFAKLDHLVLICGRYEGIDARIVHFIDEELSIGDYILSGGEIAAMSIVDATVRQIPGVLSKQESVESDTFSKGLLKYRQYTRPAQFRGLKTPALLLSGDHKKIAEFRTQEAKEITLKKRPGLLKS